MLGYDLHDIARMELAVSTALSRTKLTDKISTGLNDTLTFLQGLQQEGYFQYINPTRK